MTSARETYEALQAGMKLLADMHGAAAYGMPEYQAAWRASENIKNQNGGMPPERAETSVHFSSASNEWATPQDFYDAQHAVHAFTLDPCCTHENAKCPKHYTQAEDGLKQDWSKDRVWMNPPYGREIGIWMRKAYEESLRGALVVCLVPSRTDTAWWHDYAAKGEVTFIRGRLKFGGHTNSAPFPSAVVVFKPANI